MRKLSKRAFICILMSIALMVGVGYFVYQLYTYGGIWAAYPANQDVYTNGYLSTGKIVDRDNENLVKHTKDGSTVYNKDYEVRCATLHAVGDVQGNISTGANQVFSGQMVGYNFVTGVYSASGRGGKVQLTIDADVSKVAYEALAGRNGTVGVYNYKTGDIVCMVSAPNYDPTSPPAASEAKTGSYINKFLTASFVPGSTFKVVTSLAAIEEISDLSSFSYKCTRELDFANGKDKTAIVRCTQKHGTVNFETALAKSCNCAFAKLTEQIGYKKMEEYVKKLGLTSTYNVSGVTTKASSFTFPQWGGVSLAWAGIGQYEDLVNPCSMMVYMGAIANGGKAALPKTLKSIVYNNGFKTVKTSPDTSYTDRMMSVATASKLGSMLRNNVVSNYGQSNFGSLEIHAKSGTAEVSTSDSGSFDPHSWFIGYISDEGYPYAFVVLVENGGWGSTVAGSVASKVMQAVVDQDSLKMKK